MTESRLEQAVRHYYQEENHNCAETLLAACSDTYSLNLSSSSIRLLAGFGGGMYTGNACGALCGCTAALSAMLVETRAHETEALPAAQRLLIRNFRAMLGDTQCARIKPVHHSSESRCLQTCLLAAKAMNETVSSLTEQGVLPAVR